MQLAEDDCRRRLAAARVAYLATADRAGRPHVVPVTFALVDDTVVTAVDTKPKSTHDLRRLRNIAENPRVALLCDVYAEDWTKLWWVRADGAAAIVADGPRRSAAIRRLTDRYPQYAADFPAGPVVEIAVDAWRGWSYLE